MQLIGSASAGRQRIITQGRNRIAAWREAGPTKFIRETCGVTPTPQQEELFAALRDFKPGGGSFGVSVTSGQGTGKSKALAIMTLYFLCVHKDSLVHVMASKISQVRQVIWSELQLLIRSSPFLTQFFEWQATKVTVRGEPGKWQAIANTARVVESIQGEHAKHLLALIDEASGVEDNILDAILGGLSEPHNLCIMTSQGTRASGTFYNSHHRDRHQWKCLRFSARDSPLVDPAHIARLEAKYGKDSPVVAVRVDGEFPQQSEQALISLEWVEAAKDRPLFPGHDALPIELGLDVARFGSDSTVCVVRQGPNVLSIERWNKCDLAQTTGRVTDIARRWKASSIKVDEIGMGSGPVDFLVTDAEVVGVNVAEAHDDPQECPLLRDWLWLSFADRLQAGQIAFDPSISPETLEDLEAQVIAVEYQFTVPGGRKIDSKDKMRAKSSGSPDIADAIMLAFLEVGGPLLTWV